MLFTSNSELFSGTTTIMYSPQTLFLTLFDGKRPLRTPPDPLRPIYPVPEAHMVAQVSAQSTKPTNPDS